MDDLKKKVLDLNAEIYTFPNGREVRKYTYASIATLCETTPLKVRDIIAYAKRQEQMKDPDYREKWNAGKREYMNAYMREKRKRPQTNGVKKRAATLTVDDFTEKEQARIIRLLKRMPLDMGGVVKLLQTIGAGAGHE